MTIPPHDKPVHSRDAARHARMAYKVTSALSTQGSEIRVVPDAESNKLALGPEYTPSDFVVQHLDLRLRLVLLLDVHSEANLDDEPHLLNARTLLDHWPETTAVGLVANDEELTTVIVETYEASSAIGVPSGGAVRPHTTQAGLPIGEAIGRYLESRVPSWTQIPQHEFDRDDALMSDLAQVAAQDAVAVEQARGAKIPQRSAAREGLDPKDARWAAGLVDLVISGRLRPSSASSEIENHIGPLS